MDKQNMTNAIILPRPMVNDLLHEAQLAGTGPAQGIITTKNNEICNHYPITGSSDKNDVQKTLAEISSDGENVLAIYSSNSGATHKLLTETINNNEVSQFVISQDIKGVLQLDSDKAQNTDIELTIRRPDPVV